MRQDSFCIKEGTPEENQQIMNLPTICACGVNISAYPDHPASCPKLQNDKLLVNLNAEELRCTKAYEKYERVTPMVKDLLEMAEKLKG